MVAITYGVARVSAAAAAPKTGRSEAAASRKSWFARFFDALVESRIQQAHREIQKHRHLLAYPLDERGNRLIKTDSADLPFGSW